MEEIFNILLRADLTPNAFYVLYSYKMKSPCDKSINMAIETTKLSNDGWLHHNLLTPKSILLMEDIEALVKTTKKKTSSQVLGVDFLTKIDEYLEIFPKFKLPSGKYARVDKKTLEAGFKWFFENYTYEWETILNATRMYVDEYERQGYRYMRTSQYFIRKANNIGKTYESELATYCEVYMNGDTDYNDDGYFKERVV